MERTGFALIIIIVIIFVSQSLKEPAVLATAKVTEGTEVVPASTQVAQSDDITPTPIPKPTYPPGVENIIDLTPVSTDVSQTLASPAAQFTPLPQIVPTVIGSPPATSVQTVSLTVTTLPVAISVEPVIRVCAQQGCVNWTRPFRVPQTMNRWQVWQQQVGTGVMTWEQFIYAVLELNPILWEDGFMFKAGKAYVLPNCAVMETH